MPKNRVVHAQLLPPASQGAPDTELLERLVREKVAEIISQQQDLLFVPFFDSKAVSDAIRRLQTVPARRRWAIYFERHGCLICRKKKTTHSGVGMCPNCHAKIAQRLGTIVGEFSRVHVRQRISGSAEEMAKKALREAFDSFTAEKEVSAEATE